jgi:hypothetical protein
MKHLILGPSLQSIQELILSGTLAQFLQTRLDWPMLRSLIECQVLESIESLEYCANLELLNISCEFLLM